MRGLQPIRRTFILLVGVVSVPQYGIVNLKLTRNILQILIDSGKTQGFIDQGTGRCASWLQFMKDWTLDEIKQHCDSKGWKVTVMDDAPTTSDYYWD